MRDKGLKIKEAADHTGLSPATINRLRYSGELGYYKIGKCILIPHAEIERLMKAAYVSPWALKEA